MAKHTHADQGGGGGLTGKSADSLFRETYAFLEGGSSCHPFHRVIAVFSSFKILAFVQCSLIYTAAATWSKCCTLKNLSPNCISPGTIHQLSKSSRTQSNSLQSHSLSTPLPAINQAISQALNATQGHRLRHHTSYHSGSKCHHRDTSVAIYQTSYYQALNATQGHTHCYQTSYFSGSKCHTGTQAQLSIKQAILLRL